MLVNLLSGGKPVNSGVKFSHFYLIVDGNLNPKSNVVQGFKLFMAHLKSKFTTGKGGDSAFKLLPDSSFFNAFTSIADSFKIIEEAINVSGVNDARPPTADLAASVMSDSKGEKESTAKRSKGLNAASDAASIENSAESLENTEGSFKGTVFGIGVNCDAENLFNKDPKDANKYEIEGQKV